MNRWIKTWLITTATLSILCLFILLMCFITELDIKNIEKEVEWQKLEYYKTLNKIYKGENIEALSSAPCDEQEEHQNVKRAK